MKSILLSTLCLSMVTIDAAADDEMRRELLQTFVDEFVEITPGQGKFPESFSMGSTSETEETPVHKVTLSRPFSIARYEVPQNLYESVMGTNPSRWKGPRNSVEMMDWGAANEFCRRLTGLLRDADLISDEETIRLPTEAEWEYCCRAGTTTAYSFGAEAHAATDGEKQASLLDPYGWHTGNAAGNDPPVGALKPNPWGLYDMHGYLWEFCQDEWHDRYTDAPADGSAWRSEEAPRRIVLRGGSWKDLYSGLRSSARRAYSVAESDDAVGIRCVKSTGQ